MKKNLTITICILFVALTTSLLSCDVEKNITVVAREQGSGTREAFDKVVTDGNGNYLEMKINGKKVYNTTSNADLQKETGNVISKVASDKNAIGYISLGSVNNTIKVLNVNGVTPSDKTVLDGSYVIQRPFVIMTNSKTPLTNLTQDFLQYLKSDASKKHAIETGCIFLEDPLRRANKGKDAISVEKYTFKNNIPFGEKIKINGSTSMEKFIKKAMNEYAKLYGLSADKIFSLDLQGSSVGKTAAKNDKNGNVIGLSSASVDEEGINSFNVCLDAVVVIVNNENTNINNITVNELYKIYNGQTSKFSQLRGQNENR